MKHHLHWTPWTHGVLTIRNWSSGYRFSLAACTCRRRGNYLLPIKRTTFRAFVYFIGTRVSGVVAAWLHSFEFRFSVTLVRNILAHWPNRFRDSSPASCQHQQENSTSTSRCSCSCAEAPRKAFGVRPKASLPLWSKHGDENIWWPPFGVHVEGFHSTVHRASSRLSVDGFQLLFSFNLLKLLRKYASGNHGIIESDWTLQMSGSQVSTSPTPQPPY